MIDSTIREKIVKFNKKYQIVPEIEKALIDIDSLSYVIKNETKYIFKVSLFNPDFLSTNEIQKKYVDNTVVMGDITVDMNVIERFLKNYIKQIGFIPKYNLDFEKTYHVPIMETKNLNITDLQKKVFEIPIKVKYYFLFNDNITVIEKFYNSNFVFDVLTYMQIPDCILNMYNINGFFDWDNKFEPYPYPEIQNYGKTFVDINNFIFSIQDSDILAQSKNIIFFEIYFKPYFENFLLYFIINKNNNIYLKKINKTTFDYRKVFYNLDFINIKNKFVIEM